MVTIISISKQPHRKLSSSFKKIFCWICPSEGIFLLKVLPLSQSIYEVLHIFLFYSIFGFHHMI